MSFEQAVIMIHRKHVEEAERHIKNFAEDPEMEILNGRYGPYIVYKGNNYRLPKAMHDKVKELTIEECMQVIQESGEKTSKPAKGRHARHGQ